MPDGLAALPLPFGVATALRPLANPLSSDRAAFPLLASLEARPYAMSLEELIFFGTKRAVGADRREEEREAEVRVGLRVKTDSFKKKDVCE